MLKWTRPLVALLSLPVLHALPAQARSERSRVVQRALRQSVRIEVTAGGKVVRSASGVVVGSQGNQSYVLTNAHVVARDGLQGSATFAVIVERPRLHRLPAKVISQGQVPDEDLALLVADGEALPKVAVASEDEVQVGDDVVVVGAPYGKSLSVSSGIVSQLEVDADDAFLQRTMKTDAPVGYGASGGGVFSVPSGKLVGLVEGYRTAKVNFGGVAGNDFSFDVPMPGETFVAPPTKLRSFLARAGVAKLAGIREPIHVLPSGGAAPVAERGAPVRPRRGAPFRRRSHHVD